MDLKGKRIGWLGDWGGAYAMEPGILPLCEAALGVFEGLGAQVKRLDPIFRASDIWASWVGLRSWAIAHKLGEIYDDPARRGHLKPEAVWEIENGRALANSEILRLSGLRSAWYRAVVPAPAAPPASPTAPEAYQETATPPPAPPIPASPANWPARTPG